MRQHKNVRIKDSIDANAKSMELVEGFGVELAGMWTWINGVRVFDF